MLRVLIVDNNVELCATIAEYLNGLLDMTVAGIAYDGEQALALIRDLEPDVVILDITMPHLDGMAVLERLGAQGLKKAPTIIMLTALGREDIIQRFMELGAHYYILKPFDLQVLADRIRQFALPSLPATVGESRELSQGSRYDYEKRLTYLLHMMGVPPHLKGYQYMREAVLMILKNAKLMEDALTKELYPRLAEQHGTTPGAVEGAIRNAVVTAWRGGNKEYMAQILDSRHVDRFPTNVLLLSKLADAVRLERAPV